MVEERRRVLPFPSATLNITYILHWVIRPWLSHVFIRFIGHRALTSKGDKPVPIRGESEPRIRLGIWLRRTFH